MSIPKNDNLLTNKNSHMNKIRNKVQLIGNVGAKPNIEQTKKGQEICINGKLNHRTFEDQDGKKQYVTEVIADEVLFLKK